MDGRRRKKGESGRERMRKRVDMREAERKKREGDGKGGRHKGGKRVEGGRRGRRSKNAEER